AAVSIPDPKEKDNKIAGGARVWDATSGKELLSVQIRSSAYWGDAVFSPDGSRIAAVSDAISGSMGGSSQEGGLWVWDATTGKEVFSRPRKGGGFNAAVYSPDGRILIVSSGSPWAPGEIWVLDAATGKERFTLKGHSGTVASMTFSPDGRRIAS